MVGFFPLFLNTHWSVEATGAETTTRLMLVNGIASLVLALVAPLLGAIADHAGWRKVFLCLFATMGAAATGSLFWVPEGAWFWAVVVFGIASIGFAAANVFYDALLMDIVAPKRFDKISAFGYALGYLGGGLLLGGHLLMMVRPAWFGLGNTDQAIRVVFLTVAAWWVIFTVPLLVFVKEHQPKHRPSLKSSASEGVAQLAATIRRIRHLRPVLLFLVAYWLYIDAINTIMKVAIDFGYKLGIGQRNVMLALLVVQLISFPSALLFGWLGERIGPKRGLLAGLSVYLIVTGWAAFMKTAWEFYVLAGAVGLVQGGVFSLSRSYYARLIPSDESAEFFGFYNMIGKFAAVLGPLLVAAAAALTGSSRSAVVAILPLLLLGGVLLYRTPRSSS